jgi:hypothetical protein
MSIRSVRIQSLPSFAERGVDFGQHSLSFTGTGITGIALKTMKGLGVPAGEAERLAPQIRDAFLAHFAGDEQFTGGQMLTLSGLSLMGSLVVGNRKDLITGLWEDRAPPDNDLTVNLATGDWRER